MYAAQLAQASECTDEWSTLRCARQEQKGNCVVRRHVEIRLDNQINLPTSAHTLSRPHTPEQPEAECPNPKKGGVKCKRANANCQATCGQCSSDDCAILVANLTSELEICTASLPVAAAGCPLQALTVEEGEQWCAPPAPRRAVTRPAPRRPSPALRAICAVLHALPRLHRCADTCPGLDMHVVSSNNQDASSMPAGICVVVDATAGDVVSTTLTDGDDCLVVAGDNRVSDVKGLGGNDLMCGGPGNDDNFRGDDGNDTLNGGPGADNYFYGGYGDDTFYGGPGDDFRFGGGSGEGGDDKLYGGDGDDQYFYGGGGDNLVNP